MTSEKLKQILSICSNEELVRVAVMDNHDNNLWWPLEISDKRKRLLLAGLSTRISYNMIASYRKVIFDINSYEYDELIRMSEERLSKIVSPLGLVKTRMSYIKSMMHFIETYYNYLDQYNNDELIALISDNVQGASYKVAQCCVLYLRGYYCGVMPVDSGMKDVLLPCIGFNKYNGSIAHEKLRKDLEAIINKLDLKPMIHENGYDELEIIPYDKPLTWWAHLVLIYFKRNFCNKHKPEHCPLCKEFNLPCLCNRE